MNVDCQAKKRGGGGGAERQMGFSSGAAPPSSTSKHERLFSSFRLPSGAPGNFILLICSHIDSGGGVRCCPQMADVCLPR